MTYAAVSVYMPENSCHSKPGKGGFSFTRHPSERSDMYTKAGTTAFMDHILTLKKRNITGEFAHPLISGRVSAPSHPLDGRETAIPPAPQTECAAAQMRNAVSQTDTHSEAAGGGVRTHVTYAAKEPSCTAKPQARAKRAPRLRCADTHALGSRQVHCTAIPAAQKDPRRI